MTESMQPAQSLADLKPGSIGFGPLSGVARAAMWGQFILGEGFSVGGLNIGHVFVVVEESVSIGTFKPSARCVEAMPGGAREATIRDRWNRDYAYVQLAEDYAGQAADAAAIARAMIGTPYSFASYAALAAWRLGWKTGRLERWIDRRKNGPVMPGSTPEQRARVIENLKRQGIGAALGLPAEAICSVLADQAWSLTGKKIMQGVAHQCVTPGALAGRLLEMAAEGDQAVWTFPGR